MELKKVVLIIIINLISFSSSAELYSIVIPVPDQSELSRDKAIDKAFTQVLINLTGFSNAAEKVTINVNEETFVEALSFQKIFGENSEDDVSMTDDELGLKVIFSEKDLNKFIVDSGLRMLSSVRPEFLFWILVDEEIKGRDFLRNSSDHQFKIELNQKLESRKITHFLPIYDLQDELSLSKDDAWNLNTESVKAASSRYDSDGWILVRFYEAESGMIRGTWTHDVDGELMTEDFFSSSIRDFFNQKIDVFLDKLLLPFSYVSDQSYEKVKLVIKNIDQYADYKVLTSRIKDLDIVRSVELSSISLNDLELVIETNASTKFLRRDLSGLSFLSERTGIPSNERRLAFDWIN